MDKKLQKIKALLKEKNLTYSKFAALIGKSEPTVRNWFKGTSKIDIDTIEKIAGVLGVPVSYFFGESGGGHTIIANNSIAGISNGNVKIQIEQQKEIERLKFQLESCQKQIELLEARIKDKEELIRLLREMCK